jgi:hypothetical protein
MSIRLVLLHLLALAAWAHPHDGHDQISGPDSLNKRYRISKLPAIKLEAIPVSPRRPACADPANPFLCGLIPVDGMLTSPNCQLRIGATCCIDSTHCCPDMECAPNGFFCCGEEGFCTSGSQQCCPDGSCAPTGFECCGGGTSCDPTDNELCCGN